MEDKNWYLDKAKNEVINNFVKLIEAHFFDNEWVGLLGQRLTDFNNGDIFKRFLQNKAMKDIFNESNRSTGLDTICLFLP